MKSNKGAAAAGLIIYIASFLLICSVIAVITTFFYNNNKYLSSEGTAAAEYDILNVYLASEAKTEENSVVSVSEDGKKIDFESGNSYIFKEEDKTIYLKNEIKNKYFILCNYIDNAEFQEGTNNFTLDLTILGKQYTQTYNFGN